MSKMEETLKTDFGLDFSAKDVLLFRPALCAQITDNRTAVSKQACDLATTMVRFTTLKPKTRGFSDSPHRVVLSLDLASPSPSLSSSLLAFPSSNDLCLHIPIQAETQAIGFAPHTQVIVSVLLKQTTVTGSFQVATSPMFPCPLPCADHILSVYL